MRYKRIKNYPDYFATSDGKIYGIKRNINLKMGINKNGYRMVSLYNKNGLKSFYVHRLVTLAFIPNPMNKKEVNHIDENKLNNDKSNLEWNTRKENCNYGNRNNLISKSQKGFNNSNSNPKEFYSIHPIKRSTFKVTCKHQGWEFKDFIETDSGQKCGSNKIYYYSY